MTNFSTNQVMQFYVIESGSYEIIPCEGKAFKIYFKDYGITSDKIENVEWAKYVEASALRPKAKKMSISFAGDVVIGEDYAVKVSYPEVAGAGVESWTTKTAVAHAGKGATKATVIAELKKQLTKILGVDGVLVVEDYDGGLSILPTYASRDSEGAPNKDYVKAYARGTHPITIPDFNVTVNQITDEGELTNWVVLDPLTQQIPVESVTTEIPSGYKLADMEYFAMGERGDEYRMAAYPNHIITEYKINPEIGYDVLNIHYSYKGFNDQSHKSEKDIIIVCETNPGDIITKIQNLFGVTVVNVPTA